MRKFLKVVGWILGFVIGVPILAVGFVYWKSNARLHRTFSISVQTPTVTVDAAAVERGHHLALTRGCLDCHGPDLGGAKVIDDPAMGRLYGPNLTTGRGGPGPHFQDQDWVRAVRHGVGADGQALFLMPSTDYAHFTEQDMSDLIAYLKSVPAVDRDRIPISVGPVARALVVAGKIPLAAEVIDHGSVQPDTVQPGITVEYGGYLAVGCTGCHGQNLSGGKIDIGPPDWPLAANLTPHSSGRLGQWSEADFISTLRTARRPDGTEISPVMPRNFGQLNDTEMKALWVYLKTLPPVMTGQR